MYTISNEFITASFKTKGAELCSLRTSKDQVEYIWQGAAWPKHSPILFPIVGALKDNTYYYNDKAYQLGRHGFARDMDFEVVQHTATAITFLLKHNTNLEQVYPFHFELYITYILEGNHINIHYKVVNVGIETMPFSIGAHPAFKVPLEDGLSFEDYQLEVQFDAAQALPVYQYPLNTDGLLKQEGIEPFTHHHNKIALSYDLFKEDALVYQEIKGKVMIKLSAPSSKRSVTVYYSDFPYLGIWNKYQSDFVCIEPWCGITDDEDSIQHINSKKGIIFLSASSTWENTWSIQID